jgi:hypothetical protein
MHSLHATSQTCALDVRVHRRAKQPEVVDLLGSDHKLLLCLRLVIRGISEDVAQCAVQESAQRISHRDRGAQGKLNA